ncbi:hypothetical protein ACFP2T_13185 [Plantactinospora solaniradicis]|uniref:Helix-turn-helix domain-containing protein n=1 Tax=Plantactinospora solaniradicis TaxID=1723736 RepID=A0ABW1K660_9ACTN
MQDSHWHRRQHEAERSAEPDGSEDGVGGTRRPRAEGTKAGRPESPVVGFGPAARFAMRLRAIHEAAGKPPLDQVRLGGRSPSNLSVAKSGLKVPTRECVEAFLRGCGIEGGDIHAEVLQAREDTVAAAKPFRQDLTHCRTHDALVDALMALADSQGLVDDGRLNTAELARRLATAADATVAVGTGVRTWKVEAVPEAEIVGEIVRRTLPLSQRILGHLVFACGGIDKDAAHWRERLRQIDVLGDIRPGASAEPSDPAGEASSDPSPPDTPPSVVPSRVLTLSASSSRYPWTRRKVLVTAGLGIAGLAVGGTAGVLLTSGQRRTPLPDLGTAPHSLPTSSAPPRPLEGTGTAQDWLGYLAELVRQGPDSRATGRYAYTRVRLWARETTPAGRDGAATVEEEQLWWSDDLSGVKVVISSGPDGDVPERLPFPAGALSVVVRFPSADPAILAGQLDREQPPQIGPVGRLRAVTDINMFHPLDRQQRVAVLMVLADTPGLSYRGTVRDRAARSGIAISADVAASGLYGERVTLTFSPETGELLSQETSRLPGQSGPDPAHAATSSYALYLERSRTDHTG